MNQERSIARDLKTKGVPGGRLWMRDVRVVAEFCQDGAGLSPVGLRLGEVPGPGRQPGPELVEGRYAPSVHIIKLTKTRETRRASGCIQRRRDDN